ncbi:MAG: HAMP domain-containing sensor histidine kinase [Dermatophilaceae bacterium]
MLAIDSSHRSRLLTIGWLVVASTNLAVMYAALEESLPADLIWASFALVYGLTTWSRRTTNLAFWGMTLATSVPMFMHLAKGTSVWAEAWQIVWTGVLVYLLIWHVNRQRSVQRQLLELGEAERNRAARQELTTRFGSHEIRTRLSVARGFVELMRDSTGEDRTRSDAQLVVGELDKAAALNSGLLTLVQVELQTPARVAFFVSDLVETVFHRWTPTADRAWWRDSSAEVMYGNPERFEAALDCLVENAVKFTDDGDVIGIEAHVQRGELVLAVSDSGIGIPQEEVGGIFDTFRTGSEARERAGSGLGLSIVAAIVQAQMGTVEVDSLVGSGTCFTIRCPVAGRGRPGGALVAGEVSDPSQTSPLRGRVAGGEPHMGAEASPAT